MYTRLDFLLQSTVDIIGKSKMSTEGVGVASVLHMPLPADNEILLDMTKFMAY